MAFALSMAWKILFIVFFFGFCIFIHEFGHLLAALWMGLHVEKFSIGFGKRIWGFTYKGVEYAISLLPFGGYVALPQLDPVDNPKTSDGKELKPSKPIPRAVTAFAGPLFNVLFGFVLATIMCIVGIKEAPPSASCVVVEVPKVLPLYENGLGVTDEILEFDGEKTELFLEEICGKLDLEEASKKHTVTVRRGEGKEILELKMVPNPEWEAGLRPGDRIIAINGKSFTRGTEELNSEHVYTDAPQVRLDIIRDGKKLEIAYAPRKNPLFENLAAPFFKARNPISAADIKAASPAAKAGIKAGDQLLQINDTNIVGSKQLAEEYAKKAGEPISITIARNGIEQKLSSYTQADSSIGDFGITFSVIVSDCMPGLPAHKAGIRFGDKIIALDNQEVTDADTLSKQLRESQGRPLELKVLRDGKELLFSQLKTEQHDINGKMTWVIGVTLTDGVTKVLGHPSPWKQFTKIVGQTGRTLSLLFSPLTSRIRGRQRSTAGIKMQHMSGPVGIVLMLWYSLKNDGLRGGLALIILVTFSLGLMNLLPIPVLDGGHILFAIIELAIRRNLPPRFLNILQNIFAVLLIGMLLYITFFDGKRVFRLAKTGSNSHHQTTKTLQGQEKTPETGKPQEKPANE